MNVIKNISEEFLLQMGVQLTSVGKQYLHTIDETSISTETSLSKGIVAQKNGTIGEALSYYYNAFSFDSSSAEAKGRLSILSTNITNGNIGQSARNAIAYRNAWKEILLECSNFFKEHIPFEIVYDSNISQKGKINYISETVDLGFTLMVEPTDQFNIIKDIIKGVNKTGNRKEWGFTLWPFDGTNSFSQISLNGTPQSDTFSMSEIFQSVSLMGTETTSQKEVIMGNQLNIVIELKNDQGKIISTINTIVWGKAGKYVKWYQSYGDPYSPATIKPENTKWNMVFRGVNANDITDLLTIEISNINGINAESATRNGLIKITASK
jgi:hypothetical protein